MTLKQRIAAALAAVLLSVGLGVSAAAPAAAHETGSHTCTHGRHTTFGWWEQYERSYTKTINGRRYHVHVYSHISRWISPTHTYARLCGTVSNTGAVSHWSVGSPA